MVESNPSRRISVHQALGGGSVADLLLWRKCYGGIVLLISATTMWFLFERAGYNFLSFASNVLLLLVVILFFWAKSASLLNRPLPPIPNLEISEKTIVLVADELRAGINYTLLIAHDIAIGRNLKVFLLSELFRTAKQLPLDWGRRAQYQGVLPQSKGSDFTVRNSLDCKTGNPFYKVACGLWLISYLGSLFNFLTLVYIGILLSLSVPVLYEKYQDHIDEKLCVTHGIIQTQYRKIDEKVLKKFLAPNKEKKIQ